MSCEHFQTAMYNEMLHRNIHCTRSSRTNLVPGPFFQYKSTAVLKHGMFSETRKPRCSYFLYKILNYIAMYTDLKGKLCGIVAQIFFKITFHWQTPKSTIETIIWILTCTIFQITIKLYSKRFY